jgi:hypothetical protein
MKTCCICAQRKRIPKLQVKPICKECLYKNTPCIKCGKICLRVTKITKNGPLCTVCSNKSKCHIPCEWCKSTTSPSSKRNLIKKNNTAFICANCYNNTLPKCFFCNRRRTAFIYSLTKKPICKYCALEIERQCNTCGADFPAGIGNHCLHCKQTKTLKKRVEIYKLYFNSQFSELFKQFSDWLTKRRGTQFTSIHIINYVEYFQAIERLKIQLKHIPTYIELVSHFTVATTRKYLSVTLFFNDIKMIEIDRIVKEEFSNLDMINRYLITFNKNTLYQQYLMQYHKVLISKLKNNKTSIRSVRLALSPAVNFLKCCKQSNIEVPNDALLYAFLWATPGQTASITGFISFLNKSYNLTLKSPKMVILILSKDNHSKKQLQQSLIQLLRKSKLTSEQKQLLFKLSICYFHGIKIPQHMKFTNRLLNAARLNGGYLKMCYESFYMPLLIIKRLAPLEVEG